MDCWGLANKACWWDRNGSAIDLRMTSEGLVQSIAGSRRGVVRFGSREDCTMRGKDNMFRRGRRRRKQSAAIAVVQASFGC
jgi:hypothetical protein